MDGELMTKIGGALAALAAGWYGFVRMIKRDRREDKVVTMTDDAMSQVIATLRDEVSRLSVRLAAVEEQNRKCEERNDELHREILELKAKLHVT